MKSYELNRIEFFHTGFGGSNRYPFYFSDRLKSPHFCCMIYHTGRYALRQKLISSFDHEDFLINHMINLRG